MGRKNKWMNELLNGIDGLMERKKERKRERTKDRR
jgi:hypothetical protein